MNDDPAFTRRHFIRICASAAAAVGMHPAVLAHAGGAFHRYPRAALLDRRGNPLRAADVAVGTNYVFFYPYIATPCFLLNLGAAAPSATLETEDGRGYRWSGGIGPERSIVAFSAICAHRMSHPAREVSFINYRHEPARFERADGKREERARVIYCCSEKSVYDPAQGARVLGGPAKQPLAAIALGYDASDQTIYATGTYGGEMFERFFREFGPRLALEFRTTDLRQPVTAATVLPLAEYSQSQMRC